MLPYLSKNSAFPDINSASDNPNGLLAAGGDLSPERLMQAYSQGIFPWYSADEPILWWSPDPRTVFPINDFKVHKSAVKTLKKLNLNITLNSAFEQVINACAKPRNGESNQKQATWITSEMQQAYCQLHLQGLAHSVEVWQQEKLVGGIYGVASRRVFCGESMFSDVSNGSKIALSCLIKYLQTADFQLIDCQVENQHLISLGAVNISRKEYIATLMQTTAHTLTEDFWQQQDLNWQKLLS